LPGSTVANLIFITFALVQVADGWMTYVGIGLYGPSIEANPLIVWHTELFGAGLALTGAKAIAVFCGVVLHLLARHIVIAFLTVTYVVAALWPWTMLLWP
jgi:hypothetical protein